MRNYLVFDIGGTFIKYALMDEDYQILEQGKTPSPTKSLDGLLDALEEVGRQYAQRYQGVAISMPGRIDMKQGIAHTGGAFAFIQDTPFGALVQDRLSVPVTIANDGKCAANAELLDGALAGVDNGAVLVLGTGTGGGIVLNGQVWMGCTFAAGEFSFLPMNFSDFWDRAQSQKNGAVFSAWCGAMSATGIIQRYVARKGLPAKGHGIDGFAFFSAYDAGEAEAREALEEFGQQAAVGIYAIQSVLDLSRYAIGGGISSRPEVTEAIRTALDKLFDAVSMTAFSKPEVVTCHYGNDANLRGALHFHCLQDRAPTAEARA